MINKTILVIISKNMTDKMKKEKKIIFNIRLIDEKYIYKPNDDDDNFRSSEDYLEFHEYIYYTPNIVLRVDKQYMTTIIVNPKMIRVDDVCLDKYGFLFYCGFIGFNFWRRVKSPTEQQTVLKSENIPCLYDENREVVINRIILHGLKDAFDAKTMKEGIRRLEYYGLSLSKCKKAEFFQKVSELITEYERKFV